MARVRDLWHTEVPDPADPKKRIKKKTAKHPDNGGNRNAKRWLACWINPDGKEKTKAFAKKVDADSYAQRQEVDVERGEYVDPVAGRATFASYGKRWLGSRASSDPASLIRYESVYRLHVEPKFGKRRVASVRPSEVQQFLTDLGERFEASTPRAALIVLQGIFDLVVADGALKKNPAKSDVVKAPETKDEEIVAWADETVFAIVDAHPEHLRAAPVLGAGCGMRAGEWWGLGEEDLDFEEKVIHARRQIKKLGSGFVFALPKGGKERDVPMPDWVAQYLTSHIQRFKPRPYTLPWAKLTGKSRTVKILFRWSTDDKHVRQRNYDETVWKPAAVKAGVIPGPEKVKDAKGRTRLRYKTARGEGTHQLRHQYASAALAGGVSIKELSHYLGHADPAFTLRIYTHMLPGSFERAREAIDARMMKPRLVAARN